MPLLQITLSEEAATAARERAAEGGFGSVESYVSGLVEADAAIPVSAAVEAELVAGLNGAGRVLSADDWEGERRELIVRRRQPARP